MSNMPAGKAKKAQPPEEQIMTIRHNVDVNINKEQAIISKITSMIGMRIIFDNSSNIDYSSPILFSII